MALDNPSYFAIASGIEIKCSFTTKANGFEMSDLSTKSHKSICRSLSSNSDNSNHELTIHDHRLPDFYTDECNISETEWNSAKTVTKSESEVQKSENEDDGFDVDNLRYYNVSSDTFADRRHSTGAIAANESNDNLPLQKDTSQATVTSNCVGKNHDSLRHFSTGAVLDDHSLRHGSYPRKRCNLCNKRPLVKTENMDDILIVSIKQSNAAALWVEYFISYFQQISKQANRKPFKVLYIGADEFSEADCDIRSIAERISNVKLQLIVVCPSMLEYIAKYPTPSTTLGKLMIPDRTLALLLGVSDDDLIDVHKQVLPTYFQWMRYRVGQDQDENFTKEFLASAMAIFSKVWKQQSSVFSGEKSQFSVLPKKIKQGQNSIVIMLTHPLQKDDVIKVSVERYNELLEIKTVKRRNPYTLKISVPDMCNEMSTIINILVEKNGNIIGSRPVKCESRLRELEQILRSLDNPINFMCQSLGLPSIDSKTLDAYLTEAFQKNLPPHFNLCADPFISDKPYSQRNMSRGEFPTLLHFSARHGLENLTKTLLECPGGELAREIKNGSGATPYEIAEKHDYGQLLYMLKTPTKHSESPRNSDSCKNVKLHLRFKEPENCNKYFEVKETELYKVCPPPRPLLSVSSTESQMSLDGINNRISAISFSSIDDVKTPSDIDERKVVIPESFDLEHLQKAVSSLDYTFLPPPKPVYNFNDIQQNGKCFKKLNAN
ncbi:phosphoinositide 3-kinase adapter protein 1 [Agrilus planipennis]|uniref:Phosphoinositide 3-kinase adapter protein 1 n=1 Tax=Agrilus planipennis TaxID=224129 RepID=A0A1W4XA90_AGRPL|nr:phosphoinositide 3-kinase adapter protein 1 [Agrilus planipennis]